MRSFRLLFHVHTRASKDAWLSPNAIVDYCQRHKIDAVASTDHDSIASFDALRSIASAKGIIAIPAIEFWTDAGDIIGLFVDSMPNSDRLETVLSHIRKECGGLAVLPHPCRGHRLEELPWEQIDLIEVHNGRCSKEENEAAIQLAIQKNKPQIAGPDAHFAGELGTGLTTFEMFDVADTSTVEAIKRLILDAPRKVSGGRSPTRYAALSRALAAARNRDWRKFAPAVRAYGREQWIRHTWRFQKEAGRSI